VAGRTPPEFRISEDERNALLGVIRARTSEQRLVDRARIILALAEGLDAQAVARQLRTSRTTVRLWRRYWIERASAALVARLADGARPGARPTITAEQWCRIVALACEPPENSGRPITHWTPRELAEEAIKQGIVETISTRHVGRFLKSGRLEAAPKPVLAQPRTRARSG